MFIQLTVSALSLYYRYYVGCLFSRAVINYLPLKPSLWESRRFQTLSTTSLSNWIKIEPALSPNLLSLWPPETRTHFQLSSSTRLITFSCLRPAPTDTLDFHPTNKSPLILLFTTEISTQAFGVHLFGATPSLTNFIEKHQNNEQFYDTIFDKICKKEPRIK